MGVQLHTLLPPPLTQIITFLFTGEGREEYHIHHRGLEATLFFDWSRLILDNTGYLLPQKLHCIEKILKSNVFWLVQSQNFCKHLGFRMILIKNGWHKENAIIKRTKLQCALTGAKHWEIDFLLFAFCKGTARAVIESLQSHRCKVVKSQNRWLLFKLWTSNFCSMGIKKILFRCNIKATSTKTKQHTIIGHMP